jgi:hypothetical protein
VLFGAFTGQRPLATIARLTVGQFKQAVNMRKPVVDILRSKTKYVCSTTARFIRKSSRQFCLCWTVHAMMSLFLNNDRFNCGFDTLRFT